jgi:nucleoside-diphosphate-sugar epimerase
MTRKILVTGGTGFLGYRVIRALADEGAHVTVLGLPGTEERLGVLRSRVQWTSGDVWNPSTLRGRARGQQVVIHLVGGLQQDLKRGLTFRHLNVISARNVAQMAVSDAVPHFVLLSAAGRLSGLPGGYVESKREAEAYLRKSGLNWTIVRAPPLYAPGQRRNPLYMLLTALSWLPAIGELLTSIAPLSVDIAARGITRLALGDLLASSRLVAPGRLRSLGRPPIYPADVMANIVANDTEDADTFDDVPFGWLPPG